MNKLIRLSSTGIEYGDYAWNFASGCGNNVDGKCKSGGFKCWAYSITQRFKNHYPNGFNPTVYPEALLSPLYLKKPSRILCVFMGDLFWECSEFDPWREIVLRGEDGRIFFEGSLRDRIMMTIDQCPQHTFLFKTKCPQNLIKFSPFPENCWVGVTCTNQTMVLEATNHLYNHRIAKTQFLSIEPLLSWDTSHFSRPLTDSISKLDIDWLIIGACTGSLNEMQALRLRNPELSVKLWGGNKWTLQPKIEWVREIIEAADKAGIPVFLKDNLKPLIKWSRDSWAFEPSSNILRQEMPINILRENMGSR